MDNEEIAWSSVDALRHAVAGGRLGARDIVGVFLDRIQRLDPALQAYSSVLSERARATAARLDEAQVRGDLLGPLHGVPVALKDLCDVAGEPTKAGTSALGDAPASESAEVVERLEAAGAIVLGKVKMTEGAFTEHHESVTPPVNPWNPARWTGISSSGSGVAVAAGLCCLALGTDTGGSIRYPSSACGLTGLKPTHGRVSLRGVYPLADSLDHIGPMARSVADASRAFGVLCGHDPRDPWSLAKNPPAPALPPEPSARGARIGFDANYCTEGVDPVVRDALAEVLDAFRELGAEVVPFEMPGLEESLELWSLLGSAEIATAHAEPFSRKRAEYGAGLAATIESGLVVSGRDVARAWRARLAFARRLEGCFEVGAETGPPGGLDAILAPVIPGRFAANVNLAASHDIPYGEATVRFTSPFNLSGSPSLTICGGFDDEGAPLGFQLVGAQLDEMKLLTLGAAYQGITEHHLRRPAKIA